MARSKDTNNEKRHAHAKSVIAIKTSPKLVPNQVLEQLKPEFESKKVLAGLVMAKKAAIIAAPLVASVVWTNTNINEIPSNYSPP